MLRPTFLHPVPHNKCLWTVPRCNSLSIVQSHLQLLWCLFSIYNLAFGHPQLNHCSQQYKLIFSCIHFVLLKTSHRPTPCLKAYKVYNVYKIEHAYQFFIVLLVVICMSRVTYKLQLLSILWAFSFLEIQLPPKKAGNIINFIYSMTFSKIKYHDKTIKYKYIYK